MRRIGTIGAALGAATLAFAVPATALADAGDGAPSTVVTPSTVHPGGTVTFTTTCPGRVRSADVSGTILGLPDRIPMRTGRVSGTFSVTVTVPRTTMAGGYDVGVDCAGGASGVVRLIVSPSGGVPAGGGATAAPDRDPALMAAGGGLLAVGAVGVTLLRRRREA